MSTRAPDPESSMVLSSEMIFPIVFVFSFLALGIIFLIKNKIKKKKGITDNYDLCLGVVLITIPLTLIGFFLIMILWPLFFPSEPVYI